MSNYHTFISDDQIAAGGVWHDLLGPIEVRGVGLRDPAWNVFRNGIRQYQFDVLDECWQVFHIPHNFRYGTDLHIHAHWAHAATTVTGGSVTWGFEVTYSKGHQQAAFPATVTRTVTQNANATQYFHMIAETQITDEFPDGTQIQKFDVEVDGLILVRTFLSANNMTVSSGQPPSPFLLTVDIHYQSTDVGTKNKAPDFYA